VRTDERYVHTLVVAGVLWMVATVYQPPKASAAHATKESDPSVNLVPAKISAPEGLKSFTRGCWTAPVCV